jgi:hypothetical protein
MVEDAIATADSPNRGTAVTILRGNNGFLLRDFLSYEHSDYSRAQKLAAILVANGWSVWWDRNIPPGGTWAELVENNLSRSRCVVVIWSETSVKSKWVIKELHLADKLNIPIIPAKIGNVLAHLQSGIMDLLRPRNLLLKVFAD